MALIDNIAASQDPRVIAQVTSAIYLAAETVYSELSSVTGHVARAQFASKVTTGQVALQPLIVSACCFASLTSASTDTTVNNTVATLWQMWANA